MRFIKLLCCLLIVTASFLQAKETLHVVIAADTLAANIAESIEFDITNMQQLMQRAAAGAEMGYHITLLRGEALSVDSLLQSIKELELTPSDTVLFYFTGHGYRTESKAGNLWPNLYITSKDEGIDFAKVVEMLLRKNPKLVLAISDSCNNYISENAVPTTKAMPRSIRAMSTIECANWKLLLRESKGLVMLTAATAGDYAYSIDKGGLYTLNLIQTLRDGTINSARGVNWTAIVHEAAQATSHFDFGNIEHGSGEIPVQIPYFMIFPSIDNIESTIQTIKGR